MTYNRLTRTRLPAPCSSEPIPIMGELNRTNDLKILDIPVLGYIIELSKIREDCDALCQSRF